jgi:outer membrane lipoprotein-sorting protein
VDRAIRQDRQVQQPVNILRRLPLSRLLLLCALVVGIGVSATALAFALDAGPKPPDKPLAVAIHDALTAPAVSGVSANISYSNHLLEGASIASGDGEGGGISSSPLLNGASGRLWATQDGRLRVELQSEKGDTQIIYDGHKLTAYDAATNTVYTYIPKASPEPATSAEDHHEAPTVAKIEETLTHLREHAGVSGATPTNIAGQPAYTVRVSPSETGSLIGGAELSFDAAHGLPLRAAVYSSTSSSPVAELAATEVSYGPIEGSVFDFSPPPGAKVEELRPPEHEGAAQPGTSGSTGKLTAHGHGISTIGVLEEPVKDGSTQQPSALESLPKVDIGGTSASELRTALGTILTFERGGVRYVVAGAVSSTAVEALARGL